MATQNSFMKLKSFVLNAMILHSIQIASIKVASTIKTSDSSANLKDFLKRILTNPEDMEWIKMISYYVVTNNEDIEWENFSQKTVEIEALLVEKCTVAIKAIAE
jgi:hypothetical protein